MLPPHYQELLTAYVDGELTARQRRNVARLLRRSGEARTLLRKLQCDSREIHLLPVRTPQVDLSGPILATIHQRQIKPLRRPRLSPPQAFFPAWTGAAAAAAVFLLVGFGSFLITSRHSGRPSTSAAHKQTAPEDPGVPVLPHNQNVATAPREKDEPRKTPVLPEPTPEEPRIDNPAQAPDEGKIKPAPVKPAPRIPSEPVLASGQKETSSKLDRVELALPVLFKLDDLERAEPAGQLRKQLASAAAFRIELPCKDATRAFDRIKKSLAAQRIAVMIDPPAQLRLRKPQLKNDFALFLENVTPQELVEILAKAGRMDRTSSAGKKTPEIRFDGVVVVKEMADYKMARYDRQELRDLLGVDPISVRPQPAVPSTSIDIRRPLAESTEARVAAALDGKGVPRPTTASGKNKAMVLALSASRGVRSPELKRFLEARKPAQPGTVQVFLVLRNVGS